MMARAVRLVLPIVVLVALVVPGTAYAGRVIVTGHDADSHCVQDAPGVPNPASCAFVATTVAWVRAGAPDPAKPVLLLDRGTLDLKQAIDGINAAGAPVPYQVVDPRSPQWTTLPLSPQVYSAIVIASSKDDATDPTPPDLDEIGSTPDNDAINARAADIAAYFNAGGGVAVMSGGQAARTNSARYYGFLKITRGGAAVTTPFSLTALGRTIGFQDALATPGEIDMINCCVTHVSYELPAPESALKVVEVDKAGRAITLAAQTSTLAEIEEPATSAQTVFQGAPGVPETTAPGTEAAPVTGGATTRCVPRSRLRISLTRPKGVRFTRLVVYVNGKKRRTVSGKTLGTGRKTRAFTLTLSKTRTSKLRIVVTTASGRKLTYRQTFKPC